MSISGFSGAFSRLLEHSLTARSAKAGPHVPRRAPPRGLYGGLAHGLSGLAGGVSSGVTNVVYAPYQGELSGSDAAEGAEPQPTAVRDSLQSACMHSRVGAIFEVHCE